MRFVIEDSLFDTLPTLYVGVVAARGIDNSRDYPAIDALLDGAIALAESRFAGRKVKEDPDILPYREAFAALGINPNKFTCSVEALFTRIAKGKGMPHVNPLVDLNNAVSLLNTLPMGTHDLSLSDEDIVIRRAREGDTFLPFGAETEENPDPGELVYAVGRQVRTRRWTWRQSEHGKIGPDTSFVFFPIDGFAGVNDDRVRAAADQLEALLREHFGCQTLKDFVDREHPAMTIAL